MMQNILAVLPYMAGLAFLAGTVALAAHLIEKRMTK
jgi:hypothetical protein